MNSVKLYVCVYIHTHTYTHRIKQSAVVSQVLCALQGKTHKLAGRLHYFCLLLYMGVKLGLLH
jgi:hypothetical protein